MTRHLTLMGLVGAVWLTPALGAAGDAEGITLFEKKIRPVLVAECYGCHSSGAKALKGGLRVDSRAGLLTGGDSGPAVVPGEPDESLLLEALRYEGLEMPPKRRLPEAVVDDFARWIAMGAPDPRNGAAAPATRPGIDLEAGRRFWAYQPPRLVEAPEVADASWPLDPIDRFVLEALEARGFRPAREADRATLARRLSFDLLGLPATPEEVDAFVSDPAPDAYERLVDRLLASPHFGERWGRHWLDVVRFGESLTLRGFILYPTWRYRDYVIESFNAGVPYDRFVREQIAGDLLAEGGVADRRRQLVATTFLAIGNINLEEQDKEQLRMDVVDEQLDTIGKAFLGQTIGCARCHDHKFDPIPTKDYYAMAGILRNVKTLEHANVSKGLERPLPEEPDREALLGRHETQVAALEARIKGLEKRVPAVAKGAVPVGDLPGIVIDDARAKRVGAWTDSRVVRPFIGDGYLHDDNRDKGAKSLTFQPELPEAGSYEVRLAYAPGSNRAASVPVTILSAEGEATVQVDMRRAPPIEGLFASLGTYRFERSNQGYVLISNEGTSGTVSVDAVIFLPVDHPARKAASTPGSDPNDAAELRALTAELKTLRERGPRRETVLTVLEDSQIGETRVHVRGSVHNLGEPAPRGFLRVASAGSAPVMPTGESGRRELADWLASPANPLTARVFVNRVWHWLFGAGLVRTVDNFGTTGELPSHPELLDALAIRFVEEGWSVKRLVRRIVLSRAYRQAAAGDPKTTAADPENRLFGRANRRRLDAECLRDAMLLTAGRLRTEMGGPSYPADLKSDFDYRADEPRRSVYVPVFRNALPELFEVFDFADPSLVVGRRDTSTVSPQALFLMNHPFVGEQARRAARRLLDEPGLVDRTRLERAFRAVLGRSPSEAERRIGFEFLRNGGTDEEVWSLLVQALFASPDFRYVD